MIFSKAERPNIIAKHPEFASKASGGQRRRASRVLANCQAEARRRLTRPLRPARVRSRALFSALRAQVTEVAKLLGAKWKSMSDA